MLDGLRTSRETIIDLTAKNEAMEDVLNDFGQEMRVMKNENDELKKIVESNNDTKSIWDDVLDKLIVETRKESSELKNRDNVNDKKKGYYEMYTKKFRVW